MKEFWDISNKAIFGKENPSEKELIDFKALRGDPSDNIPGVKGIGEKTALGLIKNFKTIENLYQNINDPRIEEKTRAKLLAGQEMAFLSKKLAEIKRDVPLNVSLKDYEWGKYDPQQAKQILEELGFKSLVKKIPGLEESSGANLKLW